MTEYEWVQRCRMQFARRTRDYHIDWQHEADMCYENSSNGFNDSPEDAADEEISYWSD